MKNPHELEFFLLRYVPDAVKGEFVNVGIVMIELAETGSGFAGVRFRNSWRAVRCLDPEVDVEMFEAMERDIRTQLSSSGDREGLVHRLQDSFSNVIQVSPLKGCLAEEPAKEIEVLARLYFESAPRAQERVVSGREGILQAMRNAYEQAGILKLLMQSIPASTYTREGDMFTIDFGYHVGDAVKFFHAVSLKRNVDQAVNLAYRYPKIEAGVLRMKNAHSSFTAVIDDGLDRQSDQVQFAISMMEEAKVGVAVAAEMPRLAEVARRELVG